MHWTEHYLGIPWKTGGRLRVEGLDCWGLLRYLYANEFKITLPEYPALAGSLANAPSLVRAELGSMRWIETNEPVDGDAVALGNDGKLSHVAVFVQRGPVACVLHIARGQLSGIVPLLQLKALGFSLVKFYHYAERH